MFQNRIELDEQLKSGRDMKEIVKERIEYLESDEYKKNIYPRINMKDDEEALLINGFISKNEIIRYDD